MEPRINLEEHALKCAESGEKRKQKKRKSYAEDWDEEDDFFDGPRTWDLNEKLNSDKYNKAYVKVEKSGENFDLGYFQKYGFKTPMLFETKTGLGIRVPSGNFNVNDVKQCVGAFRLIDVMDVTTQKALVMKMRDWCNYYTAPNRERLLNVISLEFSHTKLDNYVESPTVVRQVDWVDRAWPMYLRQMQTDSTNDLDKMKYPKVRKYVLMSVGGCYTDFHIDFGGTSVWYHILKGEKIFWLIPPTEKNISLFEQWCLSGKQSDAFFADLVEGCQRVRLEAGHTFMIPTGWIHAVYTPQDSLVFGGNFLHTFNAPLQFRIWQVEDKTHVKFKFRYPYYTELNWYVLARYVSCLLGREHVVPQESGDDDSTIDTKENKPKSVFDSNSDEWLSMTPYEIEGVQVIINWLQKLPPSRRYVPADIPNPDALLDDGRLLINMHKDDNPDDAVTGQPLIKWAGSGAGSKKGRQPKFGSKPTASKGPKLPKAPKIQYEGCATRRRVRCRVCEPCRRDNCQECHFCRDMIKYGGPGVLKQCCIQKQCIAPILPNTSACFICHSTTRSSEEDKESDDYDPATDLFECGICWKILHPRCLEMQQEELGTSIKEGEGGVVNQDLPNYWECPLCIREGKRGWIKPRIPKGLLMLRMLELQAADGSDAPKRTKRSRTSTSVDPTSLAEPSFAPSDDPTSEEPPVKRSKIVSVSYSNEYQENEESESNADDAKVYSELKHKTVEVTPVSDDTETVTVNFTVNSIPYSKSEDESEDKPNSSYADCQDDLLEGNLETHVANIVTPISDDGQKSVSNLNFSGSKRGRGRPRGSGRISNGSSVARVSPYQYSKPMAMPQFRSEDVPKDEDLTIRSSRRAIHKPKRFVDSEEHIDSE